MFYIIIVIILGFMAYQLYQLNDAKRREFDLRETEKKEERIKEFMPHLYNTKTLSEEGKREIEKFFYETEQYYKEITKYPDIGSESLYEEPLQLMRKLTGEEKDENKKEKMEKALKRIDKTARNMMGQINQKRESTIYEREFVLWSYYNHEYTHFPIDDIDVYIDGYIEWFPKKSKTE